VTSLTNALQNVVGSLAIATFATVLQMRLPVHVAAATAAAGGSPESPALAEAAARAFGDVYRIAMVAVLVAWGLAWTLRRPPVAPPPGRDATDARPEAEPEAEPEPVMVGV
jgi:hypothetical protein